MHAPDALIADISMTARPPVLGGARAIMRQLAQREHPALDLELTPGSPARAALGMPPMRAFAGLPPSAVWLPHIDPATALERLSASLPLEWFSGRSPVLAFDVPDLPDGRFSNLVQAAAIAEHLRASTGARTALALRARHLAGGRRNLAHLSLLRRSLEEWDIPIMLDLSGPFDPQWEAEAGILRLQGRLALIRVGSDALSPAAVGRARVARRALRTALEVRSDLPVALALNRPWWSAISPAAGATDWTAAVTRLAVLRHEARRRETPRHRGEDRSQNRSGFSGLV